MKLRLSIVSKKLCVYCSNGSILIPSDDDLRRILTSFSKPHLFKGRDGFWNGEVVRMEDAPGETLAYVDDKYKLVVLNEQAFTSIVQLPTKYISVSEYAQIHNKCRATIKNLCVAGKLPGAYKNSSGWLIPADVPYPEEGRTIRAMQKNN